MKKTTIAMASKALTAELLASIAITTVIALIIPYVLITGLGLAYASIETERLVNALIFYVVFMSGLGVGLVRLAGFNGGVESVLKAISINYVVAIALVLYLYWILMQSAHGTAQAAYNSECMANMLAVSVLQISVLVMVSSIFRIVLAMRRNKNQAGTASLALEPQDNQNHQRAN